jgi:competence protein ComEA
MDGDALFSSLVDVLKKIPRDLYLPLGIGLAGLVFLSIGLMQLMGAKNTSAVTPLDPPKTVSPAVSQITVDVEGSVQNPGVYRLNSSARVQEALIASGGLSGDADREYVAKHINMATKLIDGGKVYIPKIGEIQAQTADSGATSDVLGTQTTQIDINSASSEVLDSLPGVGLVTAQKIIAGRPYSSVEELQTKKVVNKKVYDEIKDKVVAE